jgi:hypothetical protein
MTKPLNPKDANRDFRRFLMEAVYKPQATGMFKDDSSVHLPPTQMQRVERAQSIDELTDSDLAFMLRHAMLGEGVRPFSTADNILAHLRDRIALREKQGRV